MEFVKNFTHPDFQAKNFTPSISPNFNSFSKKKNTKNSENGEIYTTGKNFTLPPAVTAWTNSTSYYPVSSELNPTYESNNKDSKKDPQGVAEDVSQHNRGEGHLIILLGFGIFGI